MGVWCIAIASTIIFLSDLTIDLMIIIKYRGSFTIFFNNFKVFYKYTTFLTGISVLSQLLLVLESECDWICHRYEPTLTL